MKRFLAALLVLLCVATPSAHAHLGLLLGVTAGGNSGGAAPPAPAFQRAPEIAGLDYPNNGITAALSGTSLKMTVSPGVYSGNVITRSYCWHTVSSPGSCLSTGASLTEDISANPSIVGQAIVVDETVSGLGGNLTTSSYWFGPIENAVPMQPVASYELTAPSSIPLPAAPAHFLECYGPGTYQHAVYPGGAIPPCEPNLDPAHVWYIDPVNGTTQDTSGTTGHLGHAFNSLQALFNSGVSGYSGGALVGRTIPAGDTILVEPGDALHPLGALIAGSQIYSTSDGTKTGATVFTWIMGDPAAASAPVLATDPNSGFVQGSIGFILYGLNIEPPRKGVANTAFAITVDNPPGGGIVRDMLLEDMSISGWIGHSGDSWASSHYPGLSGGGGLSNGLVDTAGPALQRGFETPIAGATISMAAGATSFTSTFIPTNNSYVWSPNYYVTSGATFGSPSNGIPNGTKVATINGFPPSQFAYSSGTVTALTASQLTANTLGGSQTSILNLPQSGAAPTTGYYWLVATGPTANQTVYTWNTNGANIYWPVNPVAGDTLTINGIVWTWVSGAPTGNQIQVGSNETTSVNNAVSALNAGMSGTATFSNLANNTLGMTWVTPGSNFVVSATSTGSFSHSWVSSGTIPATGPTIASLVLQETLNSHVLRWDGTLWDDLGLPLIGLGPCDPVADAATGCPTTNYPGLSPASNVPGCDPLTVINGVSYGGCNGSPVPWAGATRALSNETVGYTQYMVITPAGAFGHADWRNSIGSGFQVSGTYTAPDIIGVTGNVSIKDSLLRDVANGFDIHQATNTILFGNRTKWTSVDCLDIYTDHRNWTINNYCSDSTQPWGHIDALQYAESNGTQASIFYSNAAVDNDFIQQTDQTNYFPGEQQGISQTDGTWWGTYIANNVVYATTNGVGTSGQYNVVVNNDEFGSALLVSYQRKSVVTNVNSLMANNVANGISRGVFPASGYCNVVGGDGDTVETNITLPFVNSGVATASATYCTLAGLPESNGNAGIYQGVNIWTPNDWQTQQAGVTSIFMDYASIGWPASPPAPGGGGLWPALDAFSCVNLSVLGFGCAGGATGDLNTRLNAGFAPTVLTHFKDNATGFNTPISIPTTGTIGDQWILVAPVYCNGGFPICGSAYGGFTFPAGVYTRVSNDPTMCGYGSTAPGAPAPCTGPFNANAQPYTPGLIGQGTALGAQMPITDHASKAWASPPSVGAYELH